MTDVTSHDRVRVPAGSRDWLLPLGDPRAHPLRRAEIGIVGISEVRRGFEWAGPGRTHLVLGTIEGAGHFECERERIELDSAVLIVAPAGLARRYASRSARWRFLAIRLIARPRWAHLVDRGPQRLPAHWLRRLLPPVEGMLAEHPLGEAVASHTQRSQRQGADAVERPEEYLSSRYADRIALSASESPGEGPRADAFELYATILRHQVETMLARQAEAAADPEAVALASLWSRVSDRPRGPWDAADLAAALGVSRTSLFRIVRRHHGTTPARVVDGLRMDEARRLLAESRHPIDVIADQIGYASAFSFSAAFKRVVGGSPSAYRRAQRALGDS